VLKLEWETVQQFMSHHPRWFEDFGSRPPSGEHLSVYRELMPGSWELSRRGYWLICKPGKALAVAQGWKLHVSATSRNSTEILRAALPVLRDTAVHFKYLMDPAAVLECNGKSFPRGSSGKFITVYPEDERRFREVGDALAAALGGFDGPYILSDLRYPGSRVVFYRYGGFATTRRTQLNGIPELLIHAPDGTAVPDTRKPYYQAPDWAMDPFAADTPSPAPSAPETQLLLGGRYSVSGAIAISNRGGVYRGVDEHTGADIVIREARPGVQVGREGIDAVGLLRHEYEMLVELADTGLFARPIDFVTEWEHSFIVEEYIDGGHLGRLSISTNPLIEIGLKPARLRAYYLRFRTLWLQIADAIAACHERGIVLGDLSPTNVMVTDDDRVRIIDVESAFREDARSGADLGAGLFSPGMATRRSRMAGRGDRRTDYYALAGLMLVCVMPVHQADFLDPAVPRRLFAEAAADLDLPAEFTRLVTELYDEDAGLPDPVELRRRIEALPFEKAWRTPPPLAAHRVPVPEESAELDERIAEVVDGVVDYLRGTADFDRDDRLFPADATAFIGNPLSVAHGAYGVFHMLHQVRGKVPTDYLAWALRHSHAELPPGLYYGTAGVAWVQSELGYRDLAANTLRETARRWPLPWNEAGVLTGTAGFGLACLRLWRDTGREEFLDRAAGVAAHLGKSARREETGVSWPHPAGHVPLGYGEGASGVAMFLLALYAAGGDSAHLDLGRAALDFDLDHAEHAPNGCAAFPAEVPTDGKPSSVLRQYWDYGTAGVLTTALRYLDATGDAELRGRVEALLPDVRRKYTAFPQLFHGISGLGNVLLDAYEYLGDPKLLGDAERAARAALCTAVKRPEGIVFPGEQLVRESCDLATGSAGVILFLDRLRKARPGGRTNANFVLDDLVGERPL
jgi:hypothetical protein